jgi:Ca-activated chloride channel homolog
MKRSVFAAVVALLVALPNAWGDDGNSKPPATAQKAADASAPAAPIDPAIRKLSSRERKDRIKALSDQYRQFLEDVNPIITQAETDAFLALETDPQREVYIRDFWKRRDQMQGTTNLAYKDQYYARLEVVAERFKQRSSDRAKIYLLHGEPGGMLKIDCTRLLQPLEIWNYYYIPGLGHEVKFVFYVPRYQSEYRLWIPVGDERQAMGELVSEEASGGSRNPEQAVQSVFYDRVDPYSRFGKIETQCNNGDEILRAIGYVRVNKNDIARVFEPPKISEEDARKVLRSVILANPNAPKLAAEFSVRYPAKQGTRTDVEMTVLVPRAQLKANEVGEVKTLSLDVTGEVLRNGEFYENFRYRFDYPADAKDEKLPAIVDRFLRPDSYVSRLKIIDINSGSEVILENPITVPEIFDTPEQRAQKEAAASTLSKLKETVESGNALLRIVPPSTEMMAGLQKIETIAVGADIKAVAFYLDGKKIAVKRQPPFTLDLDFGNMPVARRIRVEALDERNEIIAGDDIITNTGIDPFRVRIVSPRVANKLKGNTRVEISVDVPQGQQLENVELYYNETRIATMYDPPFVQTINIPATAGVGYIRAVASLKDEKVTPIEDVVMLNTPQFMEEVNVHLVELPTTVLVNGRPANDLTEGAFKVTDEGKPVKLSKFDHVRNLPLSIGMTVDTSGSMLTRMAETQKAGAQFFKNVMRQGDKAFLVAFDSEPQLIQKWSSRIADMHAGLSKMRAEEYTALYDAIVFSLYNFSGVKGQKALVVLTDGKDTKSKFTFEQGLEYARRAAVPIYAIGIGIRPVEADVRYKLNKFASETGGNTYYIDRADELQKIYNDIQNELRSQYVLGFYPPEGTKPGSKWREINVQVAGGKAKTIRGYYP